MPNIEHAVSLEALQTPAERLDRIERLRWRVQECVEQGADDLQVGVLASLAELSLSSHQRFQAFLFRSKRPQVSFDILELTFQSIPFSLESIPLGLGSKVNTQADFISSVVA